jgi:hypothetical protein
MVMSKGENIHEYARQEGVTMSDLQKRSTAVKAAKKRKTKTQHQKDVEKYCKAAPTNPWWDK